MVLAFAVHCAILNCGFVCTGSGSKDFHEQIEWPNVLPSDWVDESGSRFQFRYRLKSEAADKLTWKAVLMGDLLAVSANDPYSDAKDAMTMHLRVKDFIKSKAGDAPLLFDSKEKELISVIEERMVPVSGVRKTGPSPRTSNLGSSMGGGNGGGGSRSLQVNPPIRGIGFQGDLQPGGGGSMLYGPGNPNFDQRFRGQPVQDVRGGGGIVPGARFDPYAPYHTGGGEPDFDDFPMPGPGGPGFPGRQPYSSGMGGGLPRGTAGGFGNNPFPGGGGGTNF